MQLTFSIGCLKKIFDILELLLKVVQPTSARYDGTTFIFYLLQASAQGLALIFRSSTSIFTLQPHLHFSPFGSLPLAVVCVLV